jgi:hypothetical protein
MCPSVGDDTDRVRYRARPDSGDDRSVDGRPCGDDGEVTGFVVGHVYDAVVFDDDGVLTERTGTGVLRRAAVAAFDSFDVTPPAETVDELLRAVDSAWVEGTCERLGVDPEAFWRERDAQFSRPVPGGRRRPEASVRRRVGAG